ncbi:MAG: flavodoxin [Muribaculaceae bacterium]|nr:flavodoxin [Muribaculaceae bacterium]
MKTGIFYGSATGTTAEVAQRIAKLMGVADADVHDVAGTASHTLGNYELLILGSSTWGSGELEDDWYDFVDGAAALDLSGKKIALFGCGDETMSDTFCDAVGLLYDRLRGTGAEFVGEYPADGYTFDKSAATDGDTMRGLVLDEVNHPELTSNRLSHWTDELKKLG